MSKANSLIQGPVGHASRSFHKFIERMRVTTDHMRVVNLALAEFEISRKNTQHNSDSQIARHAITRNVEIALQYAYTHFLTYLKSILREMYHKRPLAVLGKASSTIPFHEVAKLGSYEAVCDHMITQVFRAIEGKRNTRALLDAILDKTDVVISDAVLEKALMYIEARHLLVHNAGKVDQKFADRFGAKMGLKPGTKLKGNIGGVRKAVKAISELCHEIDRKLVAGGFIDAADKPVSASASISSEAGSG